MAAYRPTWLAAVRKQRPWSLCGLVTASNTANSLGTAALVAQAMCLLPRLPAAAGGSGSLCAAALWQQRKPASRPDRRLAVAVLARDGKKRRKPQPRDGSGSGSGGSSDEG